MRLQTDNPFIDKYKHLLPPSGLYPQADIDIFWNMNKQYKCRDVEVIYVPRHLVSNEDLIWRTYTAYRKRWSSDIGNSSVDWLQESGRNPEYVFGHLLRCGFESEEELISALDEFSHIEHCDWAISMRKAFP